MEQIEQDFGYLRCPEFALTDFEQQEIFNSEEFRTLHHEYLECLKVLDEFPQKEIERLNGLSDLPDPVFILRLLIRDSLEIARNHPYLTKKIRTIGEIISNEYYKAFKKLVNEYREQSAEILKKSQKTRAEKS